MKTFGRLVNKISRGVTKLVLKAILTYYYINQEPWYSGCGKTLMSERL